MASNNRDPKGGGNSKDERALELYNRYRKERGGKIQLLAQCNPTENDLFTNLKKAVDNGAVGAFLQGGKGDGWSGQKIDLIEKCIEFIKKNGLIAGVAGHSFAMVENCEAAGIENDFYMKTINNTDYWSARHPEKNDNIWTGSKNEIADCIEFMKTVKKAWIGYKVLAAGAIHPSDGFPFAFNNGTDFVAVGMFDFQIQANSNLCKQAVTAAGKRSRPWCG